MLAWILISDPSELVTNREAYDRISEMPLYHVSHIMKSLVRKENILHSVVKKDRKYRTRRECIGSRTEGFKIRLAHSQKDQGESCCPYGLVSMHTVRMVQIKPDILAVLSDDKARSVDVVIEFGRCDPGYVHLRTVRPQLHKGQTCWIEGDVSMLVHKTQRTIEHGQTVITHDAVRCNEWPDIASEWITRRRSTGWPEECVIRSAVDGGCLMISRAHPFTEQDEIEWQIIFPHAEEVVAKSLSESQSYCLCVFKILCDFHLREFAIRLRTLTFQTVMYFACEELPADVWDRNLGGCLLYLLDKLTDHIKNACLPNYFITSNNMYGHLSVKVLQPFARKLEALRKFPVMAIFHLADHHGISYVWMLDDLMEDVNVFLAHRDVHRSYHQTMLPMLLKLVRQYMIRGWYPVASAVLSDAFQEVLALAGDTEALPSFQEFLLQYLSAEDEEDRVHMAKYLDRKYHTTLQEALRGQMPVVTLKDIEGLGHIEKLKDEPLPKSCLGNPLKEVLCVVELANRLYSENKMDDAAMVYECVIKKIQNYKKGLLDPGTVADPQLQREMIKQTTTYRQMADSCLIMCYSQLAKCLEEADKMDSFRPHIQEYEDKCLELQMPNHLIHVGDIWERFEDVEKARILRTEAKQLKSVVAKEMTQTLANLLVGSGSAFPPLENFDQIFDQLHSYPH